ncbi:RidA family protein [Chloroflexota bacterium]
MKYELKIRELGYTLPIVAEAIGVYVSAVKVGSLLFLAGVIPEINGDLKYKGKLGRELSVENGREASRLCVLNSLAAIKHHIGDLDNVKRFVRLVGYVNSAPGFVEQPMVVDGASQLLVDVFGERGRHARLAVGVAELPLGASVELEIIVEVELY